VVQKTNNMERKTRSAFKLKSGNKPSMAKIAGVSPMKADKDISGVGFQDLKVRKSTSPSVGNKYFYKDKEISLKAYVQKKKELNRKAKEINPDFKPYPFEEITKEI